MGKEKLRDLVLEMELSNILEEINNLEPVENPFNTEDIEDIEHDLERTGTIPRDKADVTVDTEEEINADIKTNEADFEPVQLTESPNVANNSPDMNKLKNSIERLTQENTYMKLYLDRMKDYTESSIKSLNVKYKNDRITLYNLTSLAYAQKGYRIDAMTGKKIDDWDYNVGPSYYVIGIDTGGDIVLLNTRDGNIFKSRNGITDYIDDYILLDESIAGFFNKVSDKKIIKEEQVVKNEIVEIGSTEFQDDLNIEATDDIDIEELNEGLRDSPERIIHKEVGLARRTIVGATAGLIFGTLFFGLGPVGAAVGAIMGYRSRIHDVSEEEVEVRKIIENNPKTMSIVTNIKDEIEKKRSDIDKKKLKALKKEFMIALKEAIKLNKGKGAGVSPGLARRLEAASLKEQENKMKKLTKTKTKINDIHIFSEMTDFEIYQLLENLDIETTEENLEAIKKEYDYADEDGVKRVVDASEVVGIKNAIADTEIDTEENELFVVESEEVEEAKLGLADDIAIVNAYRVEDLDDEQVKDALELNGLETSEKNVNTVRESYTHIIAEGIEGIEPVALTIVEDTVDGNPQLFKAVADGRHEGTVGIDVPEGEEIEYEATSVDLDTLEENTKVVDINMVTDDQVAKMLDFYNFTSSTRNVDVFKDKYDYVLLSDLQKVDSSIHEGLGSAIRSAAIGLGSKAKSLAGKAKAKGGKFVNELRGGEEIVNSKKELKDAKKADKESKRKLKVATANEKVADLKDSTAERDKKTAELTKSNEDRKAAREGKKELKPAKESKAKESKPKEEKPAKESKPKETKPAKESKPKETKAKESKPAKESKKEETKATVTESALLGATIPTGISDYELYKLLEENGFEATKENLEAVKNEIAEIESTEFQDDLNIEATEDINTDEALKEEESVAKDVADSIDEIKDKAEEVLDKAKEDVIELVDDVEEAVEKELNESGKIAKKNTNLKAIKEEVEEKVEEIKDKVEEVIEKAKEEVAELVADAGEKTEEALKEEVEEKVEEIKAEVEEVLDKAKEEVSELVDKVEEEAGETEESLKESRGISKKSKKSVFKTLKEEVEKAIEEVKEKAEEVLEKAKEEVSELVADVADEVKEGLEESHAVKNRTFKTLKEETEDKIEKIQDKVEEVLDKAKEEVSELVDKVEEEAGEDLKESTGISKKSIFKTLKEEVEKAIEEVKDEVEEVLEKAKDEVSELVADVAEEAKEELKESETVTKDKIDDAVLATTEIEDIVSSLGSNVMAMIDVSGLPATIASQIKAHTKLDKEIKLDEKIVKATEENEGLKATIEKIKVELTEEKPNTTKLKEYKKDIYDILGIVADEKEAEADKVVSDFIKDNDETIVEFYENFVKRNKMLIEEINDAIEIANAVAEENVEDVNSGDKVVTMNDEGELEVTDKVVSDEEEYTSIEEAVGLGIDYFLADKKRVSKLTEQVAMTIANDNKDMLFDNLVEAVGLSNKLRNAILDKYFVEANDVASNLLYEMEEVKHDAETKDICDVDSEEFQDDLDIESTDDIDEDEIMEEGIRNALANSTYELTESNINIMKRMLKEEVDVDDENIVQMVKEATAAVKVQKIKAKIEKLEAKEEKETNINKQNKINKKIADLNKQISDTAEEANSYVNNVNDINNKTKKK